MNKKQMTFYDWCIENNKQNYLIFWNYDENEKSPSEYSYGSSAKILFKCPQGLHKDTIKPLNNITNPTRICDKNYCCGCNSFEQWCIDNGKQNLIDLWDYDLNKISPIDVGYSSNKSFYFKCERGLHKSHKHCLATIVSGNNQVKCSCCKSVGQFGLDNIENFMEKYWSNDNLCSPFDVVVNSKKKIIMNCQLCKQKYCIRADHFTNGVRHKGCSLLNGKSNLQRKVEEYISNTYSQYTLLHENNCTLIPKSPLTNYNMYFDNEIKELKLIIEVHGEQHYKSCSWDKYKAKKNGTTQNDVFQQRQFYDRYKKDFALNHNYFYLEIPYWVEKDDCYKKLIDDKVKEINGGKHGRK